MNHKPTGQQNSLAILEHSDGLHHSLKGREAGTERRRIDLNFVYEVLKAMKASRMDMWKKTAKILHIE